MAREAHVVRKKNKFSGIAIKLVSYILKQLFASKSHRYSPSLRRIVVNYSDDHSDDAEIHARFGHSPLSRAVHSGFEDSFSSAEFLSCLSLLLCSSSKFDHLEGSVTYHSVSTGGVVSALKGKFHLY